MIGVIGAVAALASSAVSIYSSVKASKETEKLAAEQEKSLSNQRSAAKMQSMKVSDIANQGGLSAGQYNRALMENDAYATQVEGLVNKIESSSIFGDTFRKQTMAKLALSEIQSYTRKTANNLKDLDVETSIRNAELTLKGASEVQRAESSILAQEISLKEAEIARKTQIMNNVANTVSSTASLVGASVKYYGEQKAKIARTAMLNTDIGQNAGIAGTFNTLDNSAYDVVFGSKSMEKIPDYYSPVSGEDPYAYLSTI